MLTAAIYNTHRKRMGREQQDNIFPFTFRVLVQRILNMPSENLAEQQNYT